MSAIKLIGRVLNVATLGIAPAIVKQVTKGAREEKRAGQKALGLANAERANLEGERKKKESELSSRRNKLALGVARARRNRGGLNFGKLNAPSENGTKSVLG